MPEHLNKLIKSAAIDDGCGNVSVILYVVRCDASRSIVWKGFCARRETGAWWESLLERLRGSEPARAFGFGDVGLEGMEGGVTNIYKILSHLDAAKWLDSLLHRRLVGIEDFLKANDASGKPKYQTDFGMEGLFSLPFGRWFVGRNLFVKGRRRPKRIIY